MQATKWIITINSSRHAIISKQSWWFGWREIWVDNELIQRAFDWAGYKQRHLFKISDQPCEIAVLPGLLRRPTFLFVNFEPVPNEKEATRGETAEHLWQKRELATMRKWKELASLTGLRYATSHNEIWGLQHRAHGWLKDRYVLIETRRLARGEVSVTNTVIIVHHHFVSDAAEINKKLRADQRLEAILRAKTRQISENDFAVAEQYTWAILVLRALSKESPADLATRINGLVDLVSEYTEPFSGKCVLCVTQRPVQTILYNGYPMVVCASCLRQLEPAIQKAKSMYEEAPANIGRGILAAAGAALVGSIVWALVLVVIDRMAAIVAGGVFVMAMVAMGRVKTKINVLSIGIAAVISMGGVALGAYLGTIGILVFKKGYRLTWELLVAVAQTIGDNPIMGLSLFFGALGIGFYMLAVWLQSRVALKRAFKPQIEVLAPTAQS